MNDEMAVSEALLMLDAFASVGIRQFNLTRTDINQEKQEYRPGRNLGGMRLLLPVWLRLCWERSENLIVRPRESPGCAIAQLDDLDAKRIQGLRSSAFLVVETSPGSFQTWVAILGADVALVKNLIAGVGSDSRANRSGRMAGSPNVKEKYAPGFPMVRVVDVHMGRCTSADELKSFLPPPRTSPPLVSSRVPSGGWPDYVRCLQGAPAKKDGTPDRSEADFWWAKMAIERGHDLVAVETELHSVSAKAQEQSKRDRNYLERTVQAAARAARRRF